MERTTQSKAAPDRRPVAAALQRKAATPAGSPVRALQQRLGNQRTQQLLSRQRRTSEPPTQAVGKKAVPKPPAAAPQPDAAKRTTEAASPRAAIAPAAAAVAQRARAARKHAPPTVHVASAQAAAIVPEAEQKRSAAVQTVAQLDAAKTEEIDRQTFKEMLTRAIDQATPKPTTEEEADEVMKSGAKAASNTLRKQLSAQSDAAAGPMKSAADVDVPPSSQPAQKRADLKSEAAGPPPAPVSTASVVPEPLPPQRLDYSADRAPTERQMANNGVTQEQMQEANDPAFAPTLGARSTAEAHEAAAPAQYRQAEDKVQDNARARATHAVVTDLAGMRGERERQVAKVTAHQEATKGKDSQERQRITDTVRGIKDKTRADVADILKSMEEEAIRIFDAGLARAERAYEETFDEAKGGVGTWLTTWGDDWEELIESSLAKARQEYMRQVRIAIDEVATLVDAKVNAAKRRVADGVNQVNDFVGSLDASVKRFGEEALEAVTGEFEAMTSQIDQRRDGLIDKLANQYKASYERMSSMENKLREENKSLWQRVYDATVGLVKQILAFKDMLLRVLARATAVIGDILLHPVRFLRNLVSSVMQGLRNFMSKLGSYLMEGLTAWLVGALAGAGLQLPKKLDLPGIISLVLQILGLTYANFRARAVAIVGEPTVAAIEKTAEVFKAIVTEGVPGLWRFIVEQLANLKSMVLDAIFDFIKEKVIVAGITWIIGLLNPVSAFFKACKAIYDIVTFFINRGSQIMALVNAIIDSVAAIARGAIGAAAGLVENALAKTIPVAIGFLASLLGLGDPSKPVRALIEKAQAPVNKAIDWVVNLAVRGATALSRLAAGIPGKRRGKDERTDEQKRTDLALAMKEADALQRRPDATVKAIKRALPAIKQKYGMASLTVVIDKDDALSPTVHIEGAINPSSKTLPSDVSDFPTRLVRLPPMKINKKIKRQDLESLFPTVKGLHRSHAVGPITGQELVMGLSLASPEINLSLMKRVENLLAALGHIARTQMKGVEIFQKIDVEQIVVKRGELYLLQRITYQVEARRAEETRLIGEFTIEVDWISVEGELQAKPRIEVEPIGYVAE